MRIGENPARHKKIDNQGYHRVILPVYIPHFDGYYQDSFEIFKLCIQSLINTVHNQTNISLLLNGCHKEVERYAGDLYSENKINELILNKHNLGKVNSLATVAKRCSEDLITISDGDVLFEKGWQSKVERLMETYPRAGMVSPCPLPNLWNHFNETTIIENFLKGHIKIDTIIPKDHLELFSASVGRDTYNEWTFAKEKQFYIDYKEIRALLGAGHFVGTWRKEVVEKSVLRPSSFILGGKELRKFLDGPVENNGFWRLSIDEVKAHHMGNVMEDWMKDVCRSTTDFQEFPLEMTSKVSPNHLLAAFPRMARVFLARICKWFMLKNA